MLVIFGLGVIAGRHWTRPFGGGAETDAPKKTAVTARKGGVVETEADRAREGAQKLTFYQTLTAPLVPPTPYPKPGDSKARPAPDRPAPGRDLETPRTEPAVAAGKLAMDQPRSAAPGADSPAGGTAASPGSGTGGSASTTGWSVQVGAFRNRSQADIVQRQLQASGFEAFVSTLGSADGEVRYRVRLGAFRSRAEAERAAERVRAERALPTYVVN